MGADSFRGLSVLGRREDPPSRPTGPGGPVDAQAASAPLEPDPAVRLDWTCPISGWLRCASPGQPSPSLPLSQEPVASRPGPTVVSPSPRLSEDLSEGRASLAAQTSVRVAPSAPGWLPAPTPPASPRRGQTRSAARGPGKLVREPGRFLIRVQGSWGKGVSDMRETLQDEFSFFHLN